MSRRQSLLAIGIFTLILPFLGLPSSWKMVLTVAIGVVLICISYVMRREEPRGEVVTPAFSERRNEPLTQG